MYNDKDSKNLIVAYLLINEQMTDNRLEILKKQIQNDPNLTTAQKAEYFKKLKTTNNQTQQTPFTNTNIENTSSEQLENYLKSTLQNTTKNLNGDEQLNYVEVYSKSQEAAQNFYDLKKRNASNTEIVNAEKLMNAWKKIEDEAYETDWKTHQTHSTSSNKLPTLSNIQKVGPGSNTSQPPVVKSTEEMPPFNEIAQKRARFSKEIYGVDEINKSLDPSKKFFTYTIQPEDIDNTGEELRLKLGLNYNNFSKTITFNNRSWQTWGKKPWLKPGQVLKIPVNLSYWVNPSIENENKNEGRKLSGR